MELYSKHYMNEFQFVLMIMGCVQMGRRVVRPLQAEEEGAKIRIVRSWESNGEYGWKGRRYGGTEVSKIVVSEMWGKSKTIILFLITDPWWYSIAQNR